MVKHFSNKWFKRCVIVIGMAATTGIVASAFDLTGPKDDLISYVMNSVKDKTPQHLLPGDFLTTKELIKQRGFGYKLYKVRTEDGYILKMHRIISDSPNGPPVLFQHGFLSASDNQVVQKRKQALAFLLADAGFDVWLPDQRGDWYNKEHVKYQPNDHRFWDYSFHESGYYDLPAFIDKILTESGQPQLYYIGYSMGTTVFLVMASTRPEYNKKIKAAILLAPVATSPTLKELKSAILRLVITQADIIYSTFIKAGMYEFLPRTYHTILSIRKLCGPSITQDYCLDMIAMFYGENRDNLDRDKIGYQFSYLPAGASAKTAHHLSQIYRKGFRYYDYGPEENYRRYRSKEPPFYPLNNITAPVALYWGANDALVNKNSVNELAQSLPNLLKIYEIPDPKFTHIDYVFGKNNVEQVHNDVIQLFHSLL